MRLAIAVAALLAASLAQGQTTYVKPYIKSDGTYVPGHYKSAPNGSRFDNYSAQGNYNPYTGERGTKDPLALPMPTPRSRSTLPRTYTTPPSTYTLPPSTYTLPKSYLDEDD